MSSKKEQEKKDKPLIKEPERKVLANPNKKKPLPPKERKDILKG
jgi:hypothetical protein